MDNWAEIPGFTGYKVNRFGLVKSFKRYPCGKMLSPQMDKDGYNRITMQQNGKSKALMVHRIVAITFIKNTENYSQINHKDGNKQNNHVDNLEWCTNTFNQRHAWNNDLKTVRLTTNQVSEIKRFIINGLTNKVLSERYQIDPSLISNIRHNKVWKDIKAKEEQNEIRN